MKKKYRKSAGIIYSVKNKVTGEYYVGATKDSIKKRKQDHEQKANNGLGHKFQEAISTYGAEAFSWEQIDTASSSDELAQKEKQYILEFKSKEEGYNSDSGGGFQKKIHQYSIDDGSLISTYDKLENAGNAINANKKRISSACLSVNNTYGGYFWSYEYKEPFEPNKDKRKKKVLYYNFKEDIVLEFNSIAEASRVTGFSKSILAKYCRGIIKPPEDYSWEYI